MSTSNNKSSSNFLSGVNLNCVSIDQIPDPPSPTINQCRRSARIENLNSKEGKSCSLNDVASSPCFLSSDEDTEFYSNHDKQSKLQIKRRRSSPNITLPSFQFCDKTKLQDSVLKDVTNKKEKNSTFQSQKTTFDREKASITNLKNKCNKRRNSLSILPSPSSSLHLIDGTISKDSDVCKQKKDDNKRKRNEDKQYKKRRQSILMPEERGEYQEDDEDENVTLDLSKFINLEGRILSSKSSRQKLDKRKFLPPTHKMKDPSKCTKSNDLFYKTLSKTKRKKSSSKLTTNEETSVRERNFVDENVTLNLSTLIDRTSHPKLSNLRKETVTPNSENITISIQSSRCTVTKSDNLDKNIVSVSLADEANSPGLKMTKNLTCSPKLTKSRGISFQSKNNDGKTLIDSVRHYCLLSRTTNEADISTYTTLIQNMTQYPLPNVRKTSECDKNTKLTTLDKKREFLKKMGPIVQEMEEGRKREKTHLEKTTGCSVNSKNGSYTYKEINTGNSVTPTEYEELYLACIKRTKIKQFSESKVGKENAFKTEKDYNSLKMKNKTLHKDINNENSQKAVKERDARNSTYNVDEKHPGSIPAINLLETKMRSNEEVQDKSMTKATEKSLNSLKQKPISRVIQDGYDEQNDPLIISAKKKLHDTIDKALSIYSKEVVKIRSLRHRQTKKQSANKK